MIYITGDMHGDFHRFGTRYFPELKQMTRDDCVIICGDFGGVWDGGARDERHLDWLEAKPFTTLFVCGNHENFDRLYSLPVEEWHGGKIHRVRPNIIHLMRGQVYEINGKSIFTMGGAASHDIDDGILDPGDPNFEETYWRMRRFRLYFRVKGVSWWAEEMPSEAEYAEARRSLERAGWRVDHIITHCAPSSIVTKLGHGSYTYDKLTDFLDEVRVRTQFRSWYFGHYHRNERINDRFNLLWEDIKQLE